MYTPTLDDLYLTLKEVIRTNPELKKICLLELRKNKRVPNKISMDNYQAILMKLISDMEV